LTFEPDPGYSPDAGTGLLNAEFYYIGKILRIGIGRPSLQRRVVLKWFYPPRAVGTTLSEVHALYRVPFWLTNKLHAVGELYDCEEIFSNC